MNFLHLWTERVIILNRTMLQIVSNKHELIFRETDFIIENVTFLWNDANS